MAPRAREEDENECRTRVASRKGADCGAPPHGIEYSSEQLRKGRPLAGTVSPISKPTQVRPEEQNVATRKGRAPGGKVSVFPHLTPVTYVERLRTRAREDAASDPVAWCSLR